ncbi:MAG: zf-HC2 domain-containing protein [Acidobacteriota bacterium]|nr:zf-HC2 domain-containing protein [Acidobacteriota bacterium]
MNNCLFRRRVDDYLLDRMSADDKGRFEEHLFQCGRCFRDVSEHEAVLAAVRKHGGRIFAPDARTAPARRISRRGFPPAWAYAASAAAVLLAIWIGFHPGNRDGGGVPLTPPSSDAIRGGSMEGIAPAGVLPAAPSALEWKPAEEGLDYTVSLSGPGLAWSGRTAAGRIEIPPDIRAKLVPGIEYRWKVRAFAPQGGLAAVSRETVFRIAP